MFLADWSGRRVATYAITWLVGFPVLTTAAMFVGAWKAAERPPEFAEVAHGSEPQVDTSHVSTRVGVDTAAIVAHHRKLDPSGQLVFLPMQRSDMKVSIEETHDLDIPFGVDVLPWLLPPALLVAAWGWVQRSRPEPG